MSSLTDRAAKLPEWPVHGLWLRGMNGDRDLAVAQDRIECLQARLDLALDTLVRAEWKLSAYVGVCAGDKELTETVLPACRAVLKACGRAP